MKHVIVGLLALLSGFPAFGWATELLVLNKGDATLSFIDPSSGATSATISTGQGPHELAVSADGRIAIASNYGVQEPGNTLSVVDVRAREEIKRVDLGELRKPHGLTVAQGNVYFTAEQSSRIARFDPVAGKVDWTFETGQEGTHMVLASRDGSKLFTSNIGSNSIGIIERDTAGVWQQTLVGVGAGPEGLDLSPDGRELWTAHSRDGGISIIDVPGRKVIHTFDAKTKRSNRLKFTPDGALVLVSDLGSGELAIFDARKRAERARLPVGKSPTGILVAPDGARAYVAVSGDNRIAVVDLKAVSILGTIATGNSPDGMAWVR